MKRNSWIIVILFILAIGWIGYTIFNGKPKPTRKSVKTQVAKVLPKESSVTLDKNGFTPKEVTIGVGGAVRWTNTSGADQTVNSDDYPTNQLYKELNFGVFSNGSTVVYIFKNPGTYTYHNQYHPKQQGKIIVK